MKRGDLVEFKADLFGVKRGENYGIYLERSKQGKTWFAVLWTIKGRKEVKTDHLKGVRVSARGDVPDEELESRLRTLLKEVGAAPERKAEVRPGEVTERDLWRFASQLGDRPLSVEEIAGAFVRAEPKRTDVEIARNVLASCARPGVGYFEREHGREERWRALQPIDYKHVKQEIEGMNALRKRLIRTEEVEEADPDDPRAPPRIRTLFHGVPLADAALDAEDERRLDLLVRIMESFVVNDRDTGEIGLAGTPVHTIDGFRLFEHARWIAVDWTGATRVSLSSAFVEFLVDSGRWDVEQALTAIARRKLARHPDFSWDLETHALREAERLAGEVVAGPERTDLRAQDTWTIDPHDAKDHDDAVAHERSPDGGHVLWVHIADVSAYVEKDGALDRDARRRATSVYLPLGVLPMLPPRLSNDLCSLNESVDRYALTVKQTYGPEGDLRAEDFLETVIRVKGNVSYEDVDAAIREGREPFAAMEAFARLLQTKRRGLPIDTGERRVRIGVEGVTHAIKVASPATRMIETFMVAANEAVARKLTAERVPMLYRCHPLPDKAGVARFNAQAEVIGIDVVIDLPEKAEPEPEAGTTLLDQLRSGGKVTLGSLGLSDLAGPDEDAAEAAPPAPPTVRGFAQLDEAEREAWLAPFRSALTRVAAVKEPRRRELVQIKMLGAMGRAIYTPRNLGHFGLGSACYGHFTSPIRRYPDLVVHRQLRWVLRGRAGEAPHGDDLEDLAIHTSEQGSAAEQLERDVVNAALVFASRGAEWSGAVSAIVNALTKGGAFLSLEGGLEARLATADIPGGPWSVDEHESVLFTGSLERQGMEAELDMKKWREWTDARTGEARRVRLRLGDELLVALAGRDYVDGRMSAKLAE